MNLCMILLDIFDDPGAVIIIGFVIIIGLFLIFREVNAWYWKINQRISLLKEQTEILKQILIKLGGEIKKPETTTSEKSVSDILFSEEED